MTIATSWTDLTDGVLAAGIDVTEAGKKLTAANSTSNSVCASNKPKVHTGVRASGARVSTSSAYSCNSWKLNSLSSYYRVYTGRAGATNSAWSEGCTRDRCNGSYAGHLYCFEKTVVYAK